MTSDYFHKNLLKRIKFIKATLRVATHVFGVRLLYEPTNEITLKTRVATQLNRSFSNYYEFVVKIFFLIPDNPPMLEHFLCHQHHCHCNSKKEFCWSHQWHLWSWHWLLHLLQHLPLLRSLLCRLLHHWKSRYCYLQVSSLLILVYLLMFINKLSHSTV